MKTKIFTLIALTLVLLASLSAEIIKQQSFEKTASDNWGYTTDPAPYYNGDSYHIFHRDSIGFPSYLGGTNIPDDTKLWNCEDAHTDTHQIVFDTIELPSNYTSLTVNFHYFAFFYRNDDGDKAWTHADSVLGYYVKYSDDSDWDQIQNLETGTDGWIKKTINMPSDADSVCLRFDIRNNGWEEIVTFDLITLEGSDTPLPIGLENFTAKALNGEIKLEWTTENESENSGFIVYRNTETIAFIDGAGTSSETHQYSYLDKDIISGNTYTYMLADLSYNNEEIRHEDKAVTISAMEGDLTEIDFIIKPAYPNPFNPMTTLDYTLTQAGNVEINIYNMKGEMITSLFSGEQTSGTYTLNWNADNVHSGVYILSISIGNHHETQKLLLIK